jgi:hypothetical protein
MIIKRIGLHTKSEEIASNATIIFISTFFNTAILLLLTNANTSQTMFKWIPFHGYYTDLNEDWYLDMAPSLVLTMLINSIYMYVNFLVFWATGAVF